MEIKILTKSNVVLLLNPDLAACCLVASSRETGVSRKGKVALNHMLAVLPLVRVPGRERRLLETMQLAIGEFIY